MSNLADCIPPSLSFEDEVKKSPDFDVVIIGGGITGASVAYWLHQLKGSRFDRVAVIDARGFGEGATARNGGMIFPNVSKPGRDGDAHLQQTQFEFNTAKLLNDFIEEGVKERGEDDCDLMWNGSIDAATSWSEYAKLKQKFDSFPLNDYWNNQRSWWDESMCEALMPIRNRLGKPIFLGGIFQKIGAQVYPAKICMSLLRDAQRKGTLLFSHTKVIKVEPQKGQKNHYNVITSKGRIRTKYVVYANNALISELLPEFEDVIRSVRGQVIATEPAPKIFQYNLLFNGSDDYLIQRADGRIIFGGMRRTSVTAEINEKDDSALNETVGNNLISFLRNVDGLENIKIDYHWTGLMDFSKDEYPFIGHLDWRPNCFIGAGFTGHGMTVCFGAGKVIAELLKKQQPEFYYDLYKPTQQRLAQLRTKL